MSKSHLESALLLFCDLLFLKSIKANLVDKDCHKVHVSHSEMFLFSVE